MRPGIILQHSNEVTRSTADVRCDIAGILGVVPKAKWPRGAAHGDFIEIVLSSWDEYARNPARDLVDVTARRAVKAFFDNGGLTCHLIGICLSGTQDLTTEDPFSETFLPLLERLRGNEDIGLLLFPMLAYVPVTQTTARATVHTEPVIKMLLEHCREMNNRFLILDAPKDLHDRLLRNWVRELRDRMESAGSFGAVYYPWLMNGDEMYPPSGAVAGVFARVENAYNPFGVRWPPANQVLQGVTHPSVEIPWKELDQYIDANINPILIQHTRGTVIWGARTLSTDPRWFHINARRIVSYVAEQIRRDAQWVVFESQTPQLWAMVERMVRNRLDLLWNGGLLSGGTPGAEYLVKCDAETNPMEVRDAGQINCRVLLRPIGTVEYIVVDLRLAPEGSAVGSF